MNPEETQAARLADWLQSPPGTPAPEGIDEDVLAAVYTLRPDRAPPLRLTLDQLLDGVTTGPLAAPASPARASGARSNRVERTPLRRRAARAWWAVPGIGIVVTAAAAALIAIRVGGGLDTPSPELATFSEPSAAKSAPAPAPAEPTGLSAEAEPSDLAADKPATSTIAEAGPAPVLGAPDREEQARPQEQAPATPVATPSAVTAAAAPPPPPAQAPTVGGGSLGAAGASANAASDPDVKAKLAEEGEDDALARSYDAAEPTGAVASEAASQSFAKRDAGASKDERARAPAKAPAASRASAPAADYADSNAPAAAGAAPQPTGSSTAMDYNASFYTRYPDITAAYGSAVSAQSSGRYSDALAAFAGFRVSPHADVAQDAAWRAAQCLRSLGRIDDALAVVVSGLRVSSTNTPFRSNLYNLEGELYSAQGKSSEAQRAWAEAARLNALR